jgi:hypothetical protein
MGGGLSYRGHIRTSFRLPSFNMGDVCRGRGHDAGLPLVSVDFGWASRFVRLGHNTLRVDVAQIP